MGISTEIFSEGLSDFIVGQGCGGLGEMCGFGQADLVLVFTGLRADEPIWCFPSAVAEEVLRHVVEFRISMHWHQIKNPYLTE